MKNLFILFIFFFTIEAHAQNSDKYLVYNEVTKSWQFDPKTSNEQTDLAYYISSANQQVPSGKIWSLYEVGHPNTSINSTSVSIWGNKVITLIPEDLPTFSDIHFIGLNKISDKSSLIPFDSFLTNGVLLHRKDPSSKTIISNNFHSYSSNDLNEVFTSARITTDTNSINFLSFQSIKGAIYKNKTDISSFKFEDLLTDDKGSSWVYSTTNFSNSISSANSAGPGNGGTIVNHGIYQVDFKGSDELSYAVLNAPYDHQAVSFTLNPLANISNNQQGYFRILQPDGNTFSFGTSNAAQGFIGFNDTVGTIVNLNAATINSSGLFSHVGLLRTSSLIVSNENSDAFTLDRKALASFNSYNQAGGEIEINSLSISPDAISAINLSQGGVMNRIVTYPIGNSNSFLGGTFALESTSPNGFVFSVSSGINDQFPAFHFVYDSRDLLTISAQSISIANALVLRPVSEEQMLDMKNPDEGTLINNSSRRQLLFFDGEQWCAVQLKPIKIKKEKLPEKSL